MSARIRPSAARRRRRAALVVLVLAFAVVAWYGVAWVRRIPAAAELAAIAHRGSPATSGTSEGTIAAFEAAIEAGADWLEFDVRATSDGGLVVLHDETVDRTTDGSGRLADLTLSAVRELDAGGGQRIPTVIEVVRLAKAAGVPILPEIKDGPRDPASIDAFVDLLRDEGYLDRAVIQAFEAETLASVLAIAPDAETCWLTGPWQLDAGSVPAGVSHICPMGEMVLLNPDLVRQAHAAGLRLFAWWQFGETGVTNTILEAYGVDGIIVDDLRSLVDG